MQEKDLAFGGVGPGDRTRPAAGRGLAPESMTASIFLLKATGFSSVGKDKRLGTRCSEQNLYQMIEPGARSSGMLGARRSKTTF